MADGADGMQGALWVRRARGKLLRSWAKRYFVLSPDGALREYAVDSGNLRNKAKMAKKASASSRLGGSGTNALTLRQELNVRSAAVKMLPLSSAGRQHAFQLTVPADAHASSYSSDTASGLQLCLSAASPEEMHRWLHALHRMSLNLNLSLNLSGNALDLASRSASSSAIALATPSLPLPPPPPPPPLRALSSVSLASSSSASASPSSSRSSSPSSLSPRSPPPSPSASEMELAQYEDEFVDVSGVQRSDMAHLSAVYEWINECRVKTTRAVRVGSGDGSALVPRGSLLVAVNGSSLQTLTPDEIRSTLLDGEPVASLRFLRSPLKRGVLKCKINNSSSGVGNTTGNGSFTSQLKTMAQLRSTMANRMSGRMAAKETVAWREHVVEIDGDVLTYALTTAENSGRSLSYHQALSSTGNSSGGGVRRRLTTGHIGGNGSIFDTNGSSRSQVRRGRRSIALTGGCTVKPMPERVADGEFCFSVSSASLASSSSSSSRANKPGAVVFQASSEREMRQWTNTLRRAIAISEGCVPALDREYIDALQRMTAGGIPQDSRAVHGTVQGDYNDAAQPSDLLLEAIHEDVPVMSLSRAKDYESGPPGFDEDDGDDTSGSGVNDDQGDVVSPAMITAQHLPETELSGMLLFLQTQGRFVEALQLVGRNTTMRGTYWREIFQWAGVHTVETNASDDRVDAHAATYHALLYLPLSEEDEVQVQKDIPRTSKWLSGSAGAPELDDARIQTRLEKLGRVLHAFLSSCALDEHQRAVADGTRAIDTDMDPSRSFYMQGMNGIAFILLEVLEDDEVAAFEFLRGLVARVLPHVFGIYGDAHDDTSDGSSTSVGGRTGDHFDLFNSLVEVGNVLQDVAQLHVPAFHAALERAGIPVCLLAYKWFPTLFSDLSLTAYHSQLRFDTMLVIWDACLLLGLEGLFAVSLALFGAAEDAISALGADASAEQVSWTVGSVLSRVPPEDLITSVCEVLELCVHPVLLKLRNAHRRRLQLGYAKAGHGFSEQDAASSAAVEVAAMTVTDLDSGQQFAISHAGNVASLGTS